MREPSVGLWRHPDFRRLWGAQIGSAFGSRITRTALPVLAILTLRASPSEVAMLAALGVAPGLVVGLLAGARVDRSAKRPLLVASDVVRAALVFTIPLAAWLGALSMAQLYVVAAAVGAATTLFQVADATFLPALVGDDLLVDANARREATDAVAEAAGPGIAGVLVQLLGAPLAIAVDGVSYVWSALLVARIRARGEPAPTSAGDEAAAGEVLAGVRACLAHPVVRALLLADAVAYLFGGGFMALYMVLALRTLGLTPAAAGVIVGLGGVGAFAGALTARALGTALGTGRALVVAFGAGQAANLLIPLSAHAGALAVPCLVTQQLVGDALLGAYAVHAVSLRQRVLPRAVLGRANAAFHVVTGATLPVGAVLAGPLADRVGVPAVLWGAALGGLLAVPFLLASATRREA